MNPLAFSTLGCPQWSLERILEAAGEYGYQAIELRGLNGEMDLPQAPVFRPENRAQTARRIADAGIAVCCVSSSGVVAQGNIDHVKAHAEVARDLGCPYVRIFGGKLPADQTRAEGIARSAETLRAFGDAAREAGVALVLETHDSFSTGAEVAELMQATNHPSVFSLWDLHHPYRQGESPATTHGFLVQSLRHVHVKDGRDGAYTLMGDGDIPIIPMLDLILDGGYAGAISLEWEKKWHPEIAEPEIAFPQYARALRAYLQNRE